jgi:thiamine biosynthesis protein ThiI
MSLFLVRYGELGLKSPKVRRRFEKALLRNIEEAFLIEKSQCLTDMDWGRIYIHAYDDDKAKKILKRIFGITSFSKAVECTSSMEDITKTASEYSNSIITKNSCFAVRAKRTGEHSFTSHDVAKEAGSAILEANKEKNIKVDLTKPDFEIYIEVRHNRAFVFCEKIQGPGGFPMGTQGKVLSVILDKKSVYAAWLMMKRGCNVRLLCIDEDTKTYADILKKWYSVSKIMSTQNNDFDEVLDTAKRIKAEALVYGYSFLEFEKENKLEGEIPIFYPLIGMNTKEIEAKITFLFGDDF